MAKDLLLQGFKELGIFLGTKLDDVKNAVQSQKINVLETGETGKTIANQFSIELQKNLDKKGISVTVDTQEFARAIQGVLREVSSNNKELLNLARQSQPKDFSASLKAIEGAVRAIKMEKTDLSELKRLGDVERAVLALASAVNKKDNSILEKKMDLMIAGVEELSKQKLEFPKEFKLDKMQLASLSSGLRTNPGPITPTRVTLANVSLTDTGTEYSYTFPAATTSFFIKLASQNAKLNYAWASGTLPASEGGGDGTNYIMVPQNGMFSREGLALGGKVIYLGSNTASQTAQIESYQL